MLASYGGLYIPAGSTGTQALTTTAAQMVWSSAGANSVNSNTRDGDASVTPDKANNRVLVSKGVYRIHFDLVVLGGGTVTVVAAVRKNSTAVSHLGGKAYTTTAIRGTISFEGYLEVLDTDSPDTVAQFADPSSSGFAGAGGASKLNVPLDVTLALASSTDTTTIESAHFDVQRVA